MLLPDINECSFAMLTYGTNPAHNLLSNLIMRLHISYVLHVDYLCCYETMHLHDDNTHTFMQLMILH